MAKEILAVPEEDLEEVIQIIEAGLKAKKKVSEDVRNGLEDWCLEEREYLKRCKDD